MVRCCYICKAKKNKTNKVSLHALPRDSEFYEKWVNACSISEEKQGKNIYICSAHFSDKDYRRKKHLRYLRKEAVPSIKLPNQPSLDASDLCYCEYDACSTNSEKMLVLQNQENITTKITHTVALEDKCTEHPPETEHNCACTPKKRRFLEPRFVQEVELQDFKTPKRARTVLKMIKDTFVKKNKIIKQLRDAKRFLKKKITCLQELITHLREKNLINADAEEMMALIPDNITAMVTRKINGSQLYNEEIRSFALTLNFHSPKAYKYIRKTWGNILPNPSTLRKWYTNENCSPGFTQQALDAISLQAKKEKPVIINLVLGEMALREQRIYDRNGFQGGIDLGIGSYSEENDSVPLANYVLMMMAVSLNNSWKIPIGYFLIRSLGAEERANLLTEAFHALHNCGAHVYSITFDGSQTNIAMCKILGADFTYGPKFNPTFVNPASKESCYVFFDFCHMIKLVRNCFRDKRLLKADDGKSIHWKFLEDLYQIQKQEGLTTANKLTKRHIYSENSMINAKLAIQTLSKSVCDSLVFLDGLTDLKINKTFEGSSATAKFCLNFNNIGDILNCKNNFSKEEFNSPLNKESFIRLKLHAEEFEKYIVSLCDINDAPIIKTGRKTGFLGIIIALRNIFYLYKKIRFLGQSYLLTYRLSQDFLETFFNAIRSREGFNNNPNALQFKSAYKRLLVRHVLKEFESDNCSYIKREENSKFDQIAEA